MPPPAPLRSITILSPHRDDAAFSLGALLAACATRYLPVTVVNLFTQTAYAPFLPGASPTEITRARRAEDESLIRLFGPCVQLHDLALTDAPLRLAIPLEHVVLAPLSPARFFAETQALAAHLTPLATNDSLILVPLALGGHIDHLLTREAARLALPAGRLAFYEDLPYAARLTPDARAQHEAPLLAGALTPLLLHLPNAAAHKARLSALYPSQISPQVIDEMAAYTAALRGERLLLPAALAATLLTALGLPTQAIKFRSEREV